MKKMVIFAAVLLIALGAAGCANSQSDETAGREAKKSG